MTRKDYVLIAKAISESFDDVEMSDYHLTEDEQKMARQTLHHVALKMADFFVDENPRFDASRFLANATSTKKHREAIIAQLRS